MHGHRFGHNSDETLEHSRRVVPNGALEGCLEPGHTNAAQLRSRAADWGGGEGRADAGVNADYPFEYLRRVVPDGADEGFAGRPVH